MLLLNGESVKNISINDISSQMLKAEKNISQLKKCGDKNLYKYYSLDSSSLDGYMYYKSSSPMAVDEILIVKADRHRTGEIEDAINARISAQKTNFEGYGAEQTALLEQHAFITKDCYVFFAVSKNAQSWLETFKNIVED